MFWQLTKKKLIRLKKEEKSNDSKVQNVFVVLCTLDSIFLSYYRFQTYLQKSFKGVDLDDGKDTVEDLTTEETPIHREQYLDQWS